MGRKRLIYDTYDIEKASQEILRNIDKAVVATAFQVRDDARQIFISSGSIYKKHTGNYKDLASGIMIGKLQTSQVKVHSLGNREKANTYKTRFFVGGTQYRKQTKARGKTLAKPYEKGYIKPNDTIDKAMMNADSTLSKYIKNAMEE